MQPKKIMLIVIYVVIFIPFLLSFFNKYSNNRIIINTYTKKLLKCKFIIYLKIKNHYLNNVKNTYQLLN